MHLTTEPQDTEAKTGRKGKIDYSSIKVGVFNNLTSNNGQNNQAVDQQGIEDLNSSLNQLDLTNIYRKVHPTTSEYAFFSGTRETFSKMDHMLGHKTCLNKFKKIKFTQSIFADHNGMKREISNRSKTGNFTK